MAKSQDTLNTITRQTPKLFLLFLFHLVAISWSYFILFLNDNCMYYFKCVHPFA